MIATRINTDRFEMCSMPESDFFKKHVRLDVKYHDGNGDLGPEKYDYFLFANKEEVENDSYSDVYVLLFTPRSVERMNAESKEKVKKNLEKNNIDFSLVSDRGHVIYAIDSAATITNSSLFVPLIQRRDQ